MNAMAIIDSIALDHAREYRERLDLAVLTALTAIEGRIPPRDEILERATKDALPHGGFLLYWDDVPAVRVTCEQPDFSFDAEAEALSGQYLLRGRTWRVERLLPLRPHITELVGGAQ